MAGGRPKTASGIKYKTNNASPKTTTAKRSPYMIDQQDSFNNAMISGNTKTSQTKYEKEFNIEDDPDAPTDAVNSNVIIEEIEMNGRKQKVYRKTYQLVDGRTIAITRMEQM